MVSSRKYQAAWRDGGAAPWPWMSSVNACASYRPSAPPAFALTIEAVPPAGCAEAGAEASIAVAIIVPVIRVQRDMSDE